MTELRGTSCESERTREGGEVSEVDDTVPKIGRCDDASAFGNSNVDSCVPCTRAKVSYTSPREEHG